MITFAMMARGFFSHENFPKKMEEERRLKNRREEYDEAVFAPRGWNLRGNYVEDALIANKIDKERAEILDIV